MKPAFASSGHSLPQSPHQPDVSQAPGTKSARQSATLPVLLNARQAAELIGISERTFHNLRAEPWMPRAIEMRPGMPRWHRMELEAALRERAPRQTDQPAEPAQLRAARQVSSQGGTVA